MSVGEWTPVVVTMLTTLAASSGFWAYIQRKDVDKSATTRLLMGLAYDKIMTNGMRFIERGWVTTDEYEDFRKYLYEPYKEFGGNGVAERIMIEVSSLPFMSNIKYAAVVQAEREAKENGIV